MRDADTVIDVLVNTSRWLIEYRDFLIEESTSGWEWTHSEYGNGAPSRQVTGTCQAMFECFAAIDDWHNQ